MPTPLEVSAAYARLTLQSELLPVDELLEGSGVTADFLMSADYIDWRKLAAIFHNIDHQPGVSIREHIAAYILSSCCSCK